MSETDRSRRISTVNASKNSIVALFWSCFCISGIYLPKGQGGHLLAAKKRLLIA